MKSNKNPYFFFISSLQIIQKTEYTEKSNSPLVLICTRASRSSTLTHTLFLRVTLARPSQPPVSHSFTVLSLTRYTREARRLTFRVEGGAR